MHAAADLRQVARRLAHAPMFTAVTLLPIATGIGANSAIFSVVNVVLLQLLPYPNAGAWIAVWQTAPKLKLKNVSAAPADQFVFRQENQTLQQFGGSSGSRRPCKIWSSPTPQC